MSFVDIHLSTFYLDDISSFSLSLFRPGLGKLFKWALDVTEKSGTQRQKKPGSQGLKRTSHQIGYFLA
jgi:hypothetical protein